MLAVTSAPYHPATNSQAERIVSELKQSLPKDKGLLSLRAEGFLQKQHTTVSTWAGKGAAFMIFDSELTTNISRLRPSTYGYEERPEGTTSASEVFTGQMIVVVNLRRSS